MKLFYILFAFIVLISCWSVAEAGLLDRFRKSEKVCGSNGITYVNRYEFENSQRVYQKVNRKLEMASEGACPRVKKQ